MEAMDPTYLAKASISEKSAAQRRIDLEYHIQLAATNSGEIKQAMGRLVKDQVMHASASLQQHRETKALLDEGVKEARLQNEHLEEIASGIGELGDQIEEVGSICSEGFGEVAAELKGIQERIGHVSDALWAANALLAEAANILRRPLQTAMRELLAEAEKWLRKGARGIGSDATEDWKDALRLFQEVVENPIGRQNYVAWFNIGFLQWKLNADVPAAEQAFDRAQRLSQDGPPAWHAKCLVHLANMHYLQNHPADALRCLEKALATAAAETDAGIWYDGARYSAVLNENEKAAGYLEKAIDRDPLLYLSMLAEPDFKNL